ncbi:MAG: LPS export ABC transporter periplasmic protein LptC [bacterium]|nr:LPS export ABC transporter periplasmic protein LptC [bacterium]
MAGILTITLLFTLLAGLLGCDRDTNSVKLESNEDIPDQVLWDFTTTDSDSGQLVWILRAKQAFIFNKKKKVEALQIVVDMFGGQRVRNSTLEADSAIIDRRNGNMTAIGHVLVVSSEGYELRTSELHWDRDRDLFHTDAFVEVMHGNNIYTGYDMECDQNLDHLQIRREPRGVIQE